MLRKLFVTAAAAATVSVPLAGVARADKPDDPGSGNQGVPDRAAAVVEATVEAITGNGEHALDGFQSGKSGVTAPGTAFATGAKVEGLNTPDGYGVALNDYYIGRGVDPALVGGPFGRTIPGSVTKQLTHGCAQHSSESASANLGLQKEILPPESLSWVQFGATHWRSRSPKAQGWSPAATSAGSSSTTTDAESWLFAQVLRVGAPISQLSAKGLRAVR
jgi:hypothetical protein